MRTSPRARTLVLLLLVAPLVAVGCGDDDNADTASDTAPDTADASVGPAESSAGDAPTTTAATGVAGTEVDIADYAFAPTPLVASVGDTVTWTNQDDFAHTSTGDDDAWRSGDIEPGATFEHTFDEAGTFSYHCSIHNFMEGEIVVEG